ncbi:MAG: IS66 family transposase [Xanthomonadales bacterium]|nr:IS66 family transposase [Xanthomonadales bacterium]
MPIIEEIRSWLEDTLPQIPSSSATGKALSYLHNEWGHSVGDTGAWLQRVLRGHLNYYAVPGNQP